MANIPFLNNAYFAGKVGIGNSSPTKELEIGTNAAAETEFRMHSDVSGKYFNIQSAGNFTSVKTAGSQNFILDSSGSAGYITMVTNASERIRVNYNGNVGIGTTSPVNKLDVAGVTSVTSLRVGSNASQEGIIRHYSGGGNGIGITTGTFSSSGIGLFVSHGDNDRNVGIGTVSPSTKLHVNGDIRQQGSSYSVNITGGGSITGDNHLDIAANGSYLNLRSPNNSIFYRASSDHAFRDAGGSNEYLRIKTSGTNAGNVGIGTTSPTSTLHVVGTQVYKGYVKFENTVHAIRLDLKSSSHTANIYMDGTGGVISGGGLLFNTPTARTHFMESGTPKMSIISGNVGIGTTSPSARLEVAASATTSVDIAHFSNSNGSAKIKHTLDVVGSGMISILDSVNNEDVRLSAQGNSWLNAGNVGIGTTSPQTKLQIAYTDTHTSGDLSISNSAFDIYNTSSADVAGKGSTLTFSDNYSGTTKTTRAAIKGGTDTAGNTADGFLAFYTDKSGANSMQQRMIINHDGRVSFNDYGSGSFTGTATQRLAVDTNGNVIEIPIGSGPVDGSGTANYSARWIDTDTLGIGTLYDNGTNVGIGTTSPTYALDVTGSIRASAQGRFGNGSASAPGYSFHADSDTGMYRATTNTLAFSTSGSERVRITSDGKVGIGTTNPAYKLTIAGDTYVHNSNLHLNNGYGIVNAGNVSQKAGFPSLGDFAFENVDVGIGTTSPGAKLHISESSSASTVNLLYLENTGSGGSEGVSIKFNPMFGATSMIASNREGADSGKTNLTFHNCLVNEAAPIERMRITSAGEVGIGTTSPLAKLHIKSASSNQSFSNIEGALIESGGSSSQYFALQVASAGGGKSFSVTNAGNVGIGTVNPNRKLSVYQASSSLVADFRSASGNNSYISLSNNASTADQVRIGAASGSLVLMTNYTERVRVTSNGNIGIGTTSPATTGGTAKLTVNVGSGTSSPVSIVNGTTDGMYIRRYAGNGQYQIQTTLGGGNSGNLSLQSYGGNVGVGVVNPSEKLSVDGNILISDTDNNKYFGSLVNLILNADADGNSGDTARNIIFQNRGSEKMRLDAFGNVGIGTTSPSRAIDIVAGNGAQFRVSNTVANSTLKNAYHQVRHYNNSEEDFIWALAQSNSSTNNLYLGGSSGLGNAATSIAFFTASNNTTTIGSQRMTITSSGRVGIGIETPGGNLHVVGDTGSSGQIYLSDRDNGTGTGDALLINKSGTNAFIYNRDGGQLSFGTNNVSNNLVIANTGNVGIGTTSPVYKLDANGAVRAGGVITYSKPYSNLTTTGQAVAGLTSSSNGNSTGFTFTCFGDTGGYQKIVYSCYNDMGTWRTKKVINEGTNNFDVEASADGSTITFTFKSTSGTKYYTPRVTIEATGHSINSTYA